MPGNNKDIKISCSKKTTKYTETITMTVLYFEQPPSRRAPPVMRKPEQRTTNNDKKEN
jgi:hypothetical protein